MMQQNTPEWLEYRRTKIGASDCPTIMGVSPWSTPYQLWLEKQGLKEPKAMTCFMQRGIDLQDEALECFEKMTGLQMFTEIRVHPKYPFIIASLDGITLDGQHVVEIKCPGEKAHSIALSGKVPDYYMPQLQHQMEVCGHEHMYYFSYDGEKGVVIDVYRDGEYAKKLIEKEIDFWQCMRDVVPPELSEKDCARRDDFEWMSIAEQWAQSKQNLKQFEDKEKELRLRLIELCDEKNCMGGKAKACKSFRQGAIDYSLIPELKGVELNKYRKPVTISWRVTYV